MPLGAPQEDELLQSSALAMLDLEHPVLFLFARRGQHIPWAPFHSPVQTYVLILCPLGCAETSLSLPVSLHRHTEAAVADLPANHANVNWCSTLAVTWVSQGCLQSSSATARQKSPVFAPLLTCSGSGDLTPPELSSDPTASSPRLCSVIYTNTK